jgi:hypothetical protein
VLVACLLVACNHGNELATEHSDLSQPLMDLSPAPPDLSITGPSCGQVLMCVLGCGQDPTCLGGCAQGADPQTLQTVGQLVLCAATNCIDFMGGGDGGFGLGNIDQTQLFMCLLKSCEMQLTQCGGLFGGF